MKKRFFLMMLLVISLLVMPTLFSVEAQVNQLPPPSIADPVLLTDLFKSTESLQEQFRAIEFKERVSFRLAAQVVEDKRNQNVDFRQSADYAVVIKPGKPPERTFLQAEHVPRFGQSVVYKNFDIVGLQEMLPTLASFQTVLLKFLTSEYINGYKELGKEKIKGRKSVKLEMRFRPGRMSLERCIVWVDEQYHVPLRVELKVGEVSPFSNVLVVINYLDIGSNMLPTTITQEISCATYYRGTPLRLEHTSQYSDWKPFPPER